MTEDGEPRPARPPASSKLAARLPGRPPRQACWYSYLLGVENSLTDEHDALTHRDQARVSAWCALSVSGIATAASTLTLGIFAPDGVGAGMLLLMTGTVLAVTITGWLVGREGTASTWWFAAAFAVKQWLTLLILFAGWLPHLDQNDPAYGYDPQRFHFEAWELARSGFDPATIQLLSLNYGGVLYYYGAAFTLFGWSAVVPALLNCITTLLALTVVVWGVQQVRGGRIGAGAALGLILLVPDLLWFDVVASRESLLAGLVAVIVLCVVLQIRGLAGKRALVLAAVCAIGVAALRPPVLLPLAATAMAAGVLLRRRDSAGMRGKAAAIVVVGGALGAVAAATLVSSLLGGYELDLLKNVSAIASATSEASQSFEWASGSVARRLIPSAPWQVIPFALLRLVLFFVAPWPAPAISMAGIIDGRWLDWQSVFLAIASPIYWIAAPLISAAFVRSARNRIDRTELVLHFATIAVLLTVAGGNVIVQERYRVMALGLLITSALLVRREDVPLAWRFGRVMIGAGAVAAVVWVLLKV